MSPVIEMEEWLRISETTLSGTPRLSITLAAEWRSVCSPACGKPALVGGGPERAERVPRIAGFAELGGEGRTSAAPTLGPPARPATEAVGSPDRVGGGITPAAGPGACSRRGVVQQLAAQPPAGATRQRLRALT